MKIKTGDLIKLHSKKMSFTIAFEPNTKLSTHKGEIVFEQDLEYGQVIYTHKDHAFVVLSANTRDRMHKIKRSTTVVYAKDLGLIISELGIIAGTRLIEIGSGSGVLTFTLGRIIGPTGTIESIDISQEKQDQGKKNVKFHNQFNNVNWHLANIAETNLDLIPGQAMFIDIPEPWKILPAARALLENGHPIGVLCPSFEQVKLTGQALLSNGFTRIRCMEVIERDFYLRINSTRPADRMFGHTAFFIFAEKIRDLDVDKVVINEHEK